MSGILAHLQGQPVRSYRAGECIVAQGERSGLLHVLIEGGARVTKDGVVVATTSEPGAIFGDLSVLLDVPHTAAVEATQDSRLYAVSEPRRFLEQHPEVTLYLCELLGRRLDAVNKYLVDVKQQFKGHDHLGMVDGILDTLMHRQPRVRVAPKASTLRDPELAD